MSYIVPRDKPKRCTRPKCRFMDRDTLDCRLQDKSWESFEEQYEHCPLIEVPTPHGRLIDKAKLKRELFVNFMGERIPFYDCDNFPTTLTYIDLHSILSEQPTVIEAED